MMRTGIIAVVLAMLCASAGQAGAQVQETEPTLVGGPQEQLSSRDVGRWLRVAQKPEKPGMTTAASTSTYRGDDTCQHANDGECDDPGLGTGACPQFTDYSDCWRLADGVEDDSCQWANDNECDEPLGLGTGACPQATDFSDCRNVIFLRGRDDSCATAFNDVCEEPGNGNGSCEVNTDRADCIGRERPMEINDHYFGRDDRVFMDTTVFPWVVVGQIHLEAGGTCTATLIADDVLITASHCIDDDGRADARGTFETGYGRPGGTVTARIIGYFIDPNWNSDQFSNTDDFDGTDWAMLRIDQPLGAQLGHVGVRELVRNEGRRGAQNFDLYQAGYSRDTGAHLSGNVGCRMVDVDNDDTMSHNCDTTQGDSGSPFMVREGNQYFVVATDSNYRNVENAPVINIAARSEAWAPYYDDFVAGRIGAGGPRPAGPGKPPK
jgi:protease YdgD